MATPFFPQSAQPKAILAFFLGLAVVSFSLIAALVVHPQTAGAQNAPDRRLKIYPLRTELSIKAGTAYKGTFTLENTGSKPLTVELSSEEFDVVDETYDYLFLPDSSISEWVYFGTTTVELAPKAKYSVGYVVNVPIGTEPGGAYISLFGASLPNQDSSIESVDRVGSLLYITVPGDISKTGSLLSFSSPFIGFSETPWSATLRNSGTAHFNSEYRVETKTLWGTPVSSQESTSLILPRSVRLIQGSLPQPTWLGLYTVNYSIPLGDNGTAVGSRPYLFLPPAQVLALLALIAASVLFIRTHRARAKSKKHTATKNHTKRKQD
ncbi:MAG: hypothetical protein ACO1N2_02805 [Candidatus Saccharimonadota bacterium]